MEQYQQHTELVLDKEIKDSFKLNKLEEMTLGNDYISAIYNRIFIISEGTGQLWVDTAQYTISGKEIFLLSKGQSYNITKGDNLKGVEIVFGDCFWERTPASASNCKALLFNDVSLHQRIGLTREALAEIKPVTETMLAEYQLDDYPNKLDVLAAYLKILMIKLANIPADLQLGIQDNGSDVYRRFLELVSLRFREFKEVAYYAQALAITARNLSEICKQKSGKGAKEIIAGQIIAESKRQLQFTAKPVKELSYEFSFSTPEQFSHFFKKHTLVSPSDFRELYVNIGK